MDDMDSFYSPPAGFGLGPPHYPSYHHQPAAAPAPPPPPPPGAAQLPYHHLYVPPQQPPYANYAPHLITHSTHDDLRTLFIAGLPEDVKAREIYNLCREFPGYESSHLRQSSQPYAFAVFSDQQSAISAMHELNGMVFDIERGSTLYIDFAKANSRSKRSRLEDEWPGSDKKLRGTLSRGAAHSCSGSTHTPGMSNPTYNTIGYPSTQSHANGDARAAKETTNKSHNTQSGTPCPTIFVANLGPTCTEEELVQVFSRFPGFLKLKMQSTYGAPVAFVDFQDTSCSTGALNSLQGMVLYSSQGGEGMRLEYAKSRMGMRRKQK